MTLDNGNIAALENWLKKATCQLSADATTQVRTEIRQHFESAREAALSTGASPEEAEHAALAALGSPKAANREYRKVLLTRAEARMLRDGNREAAAICSRPWLKWTLAVVPLAALAAAIALGNHELGRVLLMGAVAIGFLFLVPFLPIYTAWRGRVYRTIKWTLLVSLFAVAFGPSDPKWLALMLPCLWPIAWIEWTRISIRRKIPVRQWPRQLYL